jgi:hypothetical protein
MLFPECARAEVASAMLTRATDKRRALSNPIVRMGDPQSSHGNGSSSCSTGKRMRCRSSVSVTSPAAGRCLEVAGKLRLSAALSSPLSADRRL